MVDSIDGEEKKSVKLLEHLIDGGRKMGGSKADCFGRSIARDTATISLAMPRSP
ncbi:hypothetical protein Syun_008720 [Stephania yunnanensis]|uniref:Uncharacterized protein n=1 Tax=Stephania yunnanensis TaxID=152371 RepID=A0AAP0KD33_9MAGN